MRFAVTGSIATDHLMTFPGRFTEHLLPGQLDRVSLSFLADELDVRHGGAGANIAYGLALQGHVPLLVGAAGKDFDEYRARLEAVGVDTSQVLQSATRHTARFVCTTDADQNQIATFYAGAMAEAVGIRLPDVVRRVDGIDFVLVGPDDPEVMMRHAGHCRDLGIPFAADPSQQLARMAPDQVRSMVEGADYLFTNAYEGTLLLQKTGWGREQVLERVGAWISTFGGDGVWIDYPDAASVAVPAAIPERVVDPTGAGDAFRAGFLAGLAEGLDDAAAARRGCALATFALESSGGQGYVYDPRALRERMLRAYPGEAVSGMVGGSAETV